MVVDPPGTLIKVSLLCFLAGVGFALLAALVIFFGSTRIEPRVHPSRIWADWRLHRMLWAVGVVLPLIGLYLTTEYICRNVGLRDLYWWVAQPRDILLIGRTGAASGYLLVVAIAVFLSRRRARSAPSRVPRTREKR